MFTSDIVIGLEVHVELKTKTKLFCSCARATSDVPNSLTCPICLGHPGSKPVVNKEAIHQMLQVCLALNCDIAPEMVFSRKNYFYPDMAKNYQITQFELPIGSGGVVVLSSGKKVNLVRAHLEEDPAALVHQGSMTTSPYVLVDYNRSGDPLCEIVTEPEMESPDEARDFMKKFITILNYLGVFDVNECLIKADANVSIKESGYIRSEIKNVTGFKEIQRALTHEVSRQKDALKNGEKLIADTRSWDADKGTTTRIRTKEGEADYGYILDPDLVKIEISPEMVADVKRNLPELAHDKKEKFIGTFKLSETDAEVISSEKQLAEMFEKVAEKVNPLLAAKWIRRELVRVMNFNKLTSIPVSVEHFVELLMMLDRKEITENVAQKILEELAQKPFSPKAHVIDNGLYAVSDKGELEAFCKEVIDANPAAVEDFKTGNMKSLNFLIGQVMRKTQGKASPQELTELFKKLIQA